MYEFENKDKIILRDYLALERTRLANERTLFAYIRTSLYLILGGIAFLQLEGFDKIKWLGYTSLILSILFFIFGIFRYYQLNKKLRKFYSSGNE
jgi:putative membrane protein